MSTPTIIDLKSSFLRAQILGLSRPLAPSPSWLPPTEDDALRQRNIDDALHRLNALLKQHHRAVYTPQGVRHVAEQIDALYWGAGEGVREETDVDVGVGDLSRFSPGWVIGLCGCGGCDGMERGVG